MKSDVHAAISALPDFSYFLIYQQQVFELACAYFDNSYETTT